MPLSVSAMMRETRELDFFVGDTQTDDNTVRFVYRPNAFTPGLEDRIAAATDAQVKSDEFLAVVCDLVASWDMLLDEGPPPVPAPIDVETLKGIPTPALRAMMDAIAEDQKPKKDSPSGSLIG